LSIYYQDKRDDADSLYNVLIEYNKQEFSHLQSEYSSKQPFSFRQSSRILIYYIKFVFIYIVVLLLTFYGVQTLAVLLFMRKQQQRPPFLIKLKNQFQLLLGQSSIQNKIKQIWNLLYTILRGFIKALIYLALFTPAYVMAYSIKSDFNTNSEIFLILLAVLSNSLLITYTNKFFTLLISESRKGYVLTARVKNLKNSYLANTEDGLSYKAIFSIRKNFQGHVFNHIFMNARFQYIETIKEQASFVISGLVIIEMALNIHGQFNYELLQQVLYKNFHYVALMALGLFVLVKLTDISAEYFKYKQLKRMSH